VLNKNCVNCIWQFLLWKVQIDFTCFTNAMYSLQYMLFPGELDSDCESDILESSDGESDVIVGTTITSKRHQRSVDMSVGRKQKKKCSSESLRNNCPKRLKHGTTTKGAGKIPANMCYTVDGVMTSWNDTTEYGTSFRNLTVEEQRAEVQQLNKGAEKQLKGIIKNKLIAVNYATLVAEKFREHLSASRVAQVAMFHVSPKTVSITLSNPNFKSVGEWVEVDADRTPGYNSEGGIAVIISVHDNLADVKYVLTKWVEKLVPIRRLTTIAMPHRGPRASLRHGKPVVQELAAVVKTKGGSNFRTMSAVQILKYGFTQNLWKKKGWLFDLLHREGIVNGSRQSRKEHCWTYYKSQMLYIEAVQDAKQDCDFDPRSSDHKTGKDGKFVKVKHGGRRIH
jgi:hypothetical protein